MPPPEKCVRCGRLGHDRRRLWMRCGYQMQELSVPFEEATIHDLDDGPPRFFYTLKVCKGCRGDWLASIESWFKAKPTFIEINDGEVLVEDIPPDPQEARIKELEQKLATANSLCRIAEARFRARCQMLKDAEDATCNAVGDLETAENRILELEEKGKPTDQRTCIKCGGTDRKVFYFTNDGCEDRKSWITRKTTHVRYLVCIRLKCPNDEDHLHIVCKICGFQHWQHCADHVEEER